MKIFNARTGILQPIPFVLGEAGRGRHLEEIKISNRPGQEPSGPEDVSYFLFGAGSSQHCLLTRADNRRGIMLRIDTRGVYTRDSSGRVSLVGGQATLLASGQWAEGAAGRVAQGPDQLWHVEGPSLWEVFIQGGSYKSAGLRYLVVGRSMIPRLIKPDELIQMIATDGDPDVTETVRAHAQQIGTVGGTSGDERRAAVLDAFRLADFLEGHSSSDETVTHFSQDDLRSAVMEHSIAIPVSYADAIGGVSGVQSGTLVPGTHQLLALRIGPGGGKRHSYEIIGETGVERLSTQRERGYERALYIVSDPAWSVAWITLHDYAPREYTIADASGIHTYTPAWADGPDGGRRTQAWPGIPEGTAPDFSEVFPMLADKERNMSPAAPAQVADLAAPAAPAQVADLAARFNRR